MPRRVPLDPELARLPRRLAKLYNACRPWTGAIDSRGYPRTKVGGRSAYAHRVAFERHWRPLRDGERVYRRCGDRACVNPWHLTTERPAPKGKGRSGSAKLTARKARNIRLAWARVDRPTQRALAARYGVSRSAISLVVRGLTWRETGGPAPVRTPAAPPKAPASPERPCGPRWDRETGTLVPGSLRR